MAAHEGLLPITPTSFKENQKVKRKDTEKIDIELKTRWLYTSALTLIIANHIIDQVSSNIGIEPLPTFFFVAVGLFLLALRVFCIALYCQVKQVLISSVIIALSIGSWLLSGQNYLFVATFLLLGIGNLPIRNLLKVVSATILLLVSFLGLLQLFQFVFTGDLPGVTSREDGRLRLSFFFQHPNMLAAYISMAYIGLSLSNKDFKAGMALLGIALAVVSMWVTDSRTAGLIMVLYIILRLSVHVWTRFGSILKLVYVGVPFLLVFLVVLVSMALVPDSLYNALQTALTGRPAFWEFQYQQLGGFTLLGQHALSGTIMVDGWTYYNVTIDCFYAAALLSLGSWSLVVFYALYIRIGNFSFRKRDWGVAIAIFCCMLYGLAEIHMIDFSVALPMLIMGEKLFCPKSEVIEK